MSQIIKVQTNTLKNVLSVHLHSDITTLQINEISNKV